MLCQKVGTISCRFLMYKPNSLSDNFLILHSREIHTMKSPGYFYAERR